MVGEESRGTSDGFFLYPLLPEQGFWLVIQKQVNVLSGDSAHYPVAEIGIDVIVQVADVAVICVWGETLFPCIEGEEAFHKVLEGLMRVVFLR